MPRTYSAGMWRSDYVALRIWPLDTQKDALLDDTRKLALSENKGFCKFALANQDSTELVSFQQRKAIALYCTICAVVGYGRSAVCYAVCIGLVSEWNPR